MKGLFLIFFILAFSYCIKAQTLKDSITNYYSYVDTTKRKVFVLVEEMPSIVLNNLLQKQVVNKLKFKKTSYSPLRIWFGFVIEKNKKITNIKVYPEYDCRYSKAVIHESNKLVKQFKGLLNTIKTSAGRIMGKSVAVCYSGVIHLAPQ